MKLPFALLHNHSTFSFLDGYGDPEDHVEVAAEMGYDAYAFTEHGNVYSWPKLQLSAKEHGINPVFGIEAYVVDRVSDSGHNTGKKKSEIEKIERYNYVHLTVLARDATGIQNLMKLVTVSNSDECFYQKPKIDWEILWRYRAGLTVLSGCWSGYLNHHTRQDQKKQRKWLLFMKKAFGEHFFIEVMPHDHRHQAEINSYALQVAQELGIKLCCTNDNHYPRQGDHHAQDLLICCQSRLRYSDPDRRRYTIHSLYIKPPKVILAELMDTGFSRIEAERAMGNAWGIANECSANIPAAAPIDFPYDGDKIQYFKSLVKAGWQRLGIPTTREYRERYLKEFGLIQDKGFLDYFLIIHDLINEARSRGILVGPARGSSCGSLVCYALGITLIDPIPWNLLFERFIDANRDDLPDIDIDFQHDRTDEMFDYLVSKYGKNNVATIATFSYFKGKSALDGVGSAYGISIPTIKRFKTFIPDLTFAGDPNQYRTIENAIAEFDEVADIVQEYPQLADAALIEGSVRHTSQHAAGVIISTKRPIDEYFPTNRDGAIALDKDDAERLGHLKIDVLSLASLTVLAKAKELIDQTEGDTDQSAEEFFMDLPLDDEEVFEAFSAGRVYGIFQFDGDTTGAVCAKVKPDNFGELVDINALSRPGPLASGGTDSYISRKFKNEKIVYNLSGIKEITQATKGVLLYQEQVMQIVRQCAGFSWGDTNKLRKLIAKSKGVEALEELRQQFIDGVDWDESDADEMWDQICTFGRYAFNKSHAVAYTYIGYWAMWLKVHYPMQLYGAIAMADKSEDKRKRALREFVGTGGIIAPLNINRSRLRFSLQDGQLVPGFLDIKGVGEKSAQAIIDGQPYKNLADFTERIPARQANKIVKGALHAMRAFGKESKSDLDESEANKKYATWSYEDIDFSEKRGGLPTIEHIFQNVKHGRDVVFLARVKKTKVYDARKSGYGQDITDGKYHSCELTVEDETETIGVRLNRHIYPHYKERIAKGRAIRVSGEVTTRTMRKKVNVDNLIFLKE